jgi:ceramide glucosyltransferase
MHLLNLALAGLAVLSCALVAWQWLAARRFPLHQKSLAEGFAPAISILKPLKGCDETTRASLESWFKHAYAGRIEILFGVADADDPACAVVQQLIAENPGCPARLIVCENLVGANAKVAKLAQLEKLAAHDLILISDADVRVQPDFLASFVAPLRDDRTALVNCFYRLANPATRAMQWEAVAVNADFWSQVLQSQTLKPLNFALGAAILVRRRALDEIGGFASLANCLADDYQLGKRIAAYGHRIALCPVVVECWDMPQNWRRVWKHQLRWARTIRVCQPAPYFFSISSNASLWAVLWLAAALVAGDSFCAASAAGFILLLRILLAQNLQRRFTPGRAPIAPFWLVPVKDFLHAALWLAAFLGGTIEWRGREMKVRADGTLEDQGNQPRMNTDGHA